MLSFKHGKRFRPKTWPKTSLFIVARQTCHRARCARNFTTTKLSELHSPIILNWLLCNYLPAQSLGRCRFQPDCLLRPLCVRRPRRPQHVGEQPTRAHARIAHFPRFCGFRALCPPHQVREQPSCTAGGRDKCVPPTPRLEKVIHSYSQASQAQSQGKPLHLARPQSILRGMASAVSKPGPQKPPKLFAIQGLTSGYPRLLSLQQTRQASALRSTLNSGGFFLFPTSRGGL